MSKNGNLVRKDIKEKIKLIEGTDCYYASELGYIYKKDNHGKFLKLKRSENNRNGYLYVGIRYSGDKSNTNRRVHVLIAKSFISNPNSYPYVGHRDNNKKHDSINNLYWTTAQENTQKAVDDGLMVNAMGIEDSQALPIACYDNEGTLKAVYGSISEAGRIIEGTSKSSIAKVLDKSSHGMKGFIYKTISKEFYYKNKAISGVKLHTKPMVKRRRNFALLYNGKQVVVSDNQKETGLKYSIPQSIISAFVNGKRVTPYKGYTAKLVLQEKL